MCLAENHSIYKNITTQVCKFDRTTKLNGDVVEGTQVCPAPVVEKVFVRNDITEVTEYRDGDNPVLDGYPVKVGDVVFFPSSVFHRTIPFSSNEERICIAFDVKPQVI